ncbi:MAG: aldo/keto reductase [Lachnospiraceae bacterium]|nr:aldo/keto reductase [Lachnospiraceae bacterium]
MQYLKFHEWELSRLGLGTMRLPEKDGRIDYDRTAEMIDYALKHGINYFDTAYRYHNGESESVVGEILNRYPRDTWHLVDKFPGHMLSKEADGRLAFHGFPGRTDYFDSAADLFEIQIKKCGVDYFDIYFLHNVNDTSVEFYADDSIGVVEYLFEQKKLGRIKHLGFSSHGSPETIDKFLTKYEGVFDEVQIQINYLDWTLQDAETKYEVITRHGIPVVSMESIRGGALARLPEGAAKILKDAEPDRTQASWALRWLIALPNIGVVLSGMSSLEQLKENIELFDEYNPLDEEEIRIVESAVAALQERIPCTACRYCTEGCPMGLNIPQLIEYYNQLKAGGSLWDIMGGMNQIEKDKWPAACIECGACRSICPQGINVPQVLKDFAAQL